MQIEPSIIPDAEIKKGKWKKPFLTYSTWQSFLDCPAKFYFEYFQGLKETQNIPMGIGIAWDVGLTEIAQQIIDNRQLSLDSSLEALTTSYTTEMAKVVFEDKDVFTTAALAKFVALGRPQEQFYIAQDNFKKFWLQWLQDRLKEYMHLVAPKIRPIAAQSKFYLDLGPDVPFGFKGVMDRVDEGGIVVDNKTAKSRWKESDLAKDLQLVGYALAYRTMTHKVEKQIQFDILVKLKTKTLSYAWQQMARVVEPHEFTLLLTELATMYQSLASGLLYRRALKYGGSCGYCDYFDHCYRPSHVWSKPPSKQEVEAFEAANGTENTQAFIQGETSKERLVNWMEVGQEFAAAMRKDPAKLQFWYH